MIRKIIPRKNIFSIKRSTEIHKEPVVEPIIEIEEEIIVPVHDTDKKKHRKYLPGEKLLKTMNKQAKKDNKHKTHNEHDIYRIKNSILRNIQLINK